MGRAICTVYFAGEEWSPGERIAFDAEDEEQAEEEAREWAHSHWPDQTIESVRVEWIEDTERDWR
jgi:hypothetical protein